jgi:hypothetical protein
MSPGRVLQDARRGFYVSKPGRPPPRRINLKKSLFFAEYMDDDASLPHDPATAALVNDLLANFAAFDRAVSRADPTRATRAELHQLIAALGAVEAALDPIVAAANAPGAPGVHLGRHDPRARATLTSSGKPPLGSWTDARSR